MLRPHPRGARSTPTTASIRTACSPATPFRDPEATALLRTCHGPGTGRVLRSLNTILELELAGVVRYVHYSLMVFGHARIPIIGWMRNQAIEGMNHASIAGEHVTSARRSPAPQDRP